MILLSLIEPSLFWKTSGWSYYGYARSKPDCASSTWSYSHDWEFETSLKFRLFIDSKIAWRNKGIYVELMTGNKSDFGIHFCRMQMISTVLAINSRYDVLLKNRAHDESKIQSKDAVKEAKPTK